MAREPKKSCFQYAMANKQDLWFSTKDTISKKYDHTFKDIFQEIYDNEYKAKFEELGIEYFYTLIDDAVARVIRSEIRDRLLVILPSSMVLMQACSSLSAKLHSSGI